MNPSNKNVPVIADLSGCKNLTRILDRIGDTWTVLVIGTLFAEQKPLRHSALRKQIQGISQRMLTLTLKGLEADGLVKRTVYPTVPAKVEYELTDLGRSLHEPIMGLLSWAVQHQPDIESVRNK